MARHYDAIVIGAGPAGEVAVSRLAAGGLRTALVERELIGGECAYWACIPSKTLLRATEVRAEAARTAGVTEPERHFEELAAYRDYMVRNLDDSAQVKGYCEEGADVYKGVAAVAGPGEIVVEDDMLTADRIVIATGSEQQIPAIEGLEQAGYWTNREATTLGAIPESVVVLGGGPAGIELSQFLARFGARVTLVHSHERLMAREEAPVGELIASALHEDGIELHLGTHATSVAREGGTRRVTLSSGEQISGSELLVATGRAPRVDGLGLENAGITTTSAGIAVDERCRAGEGVWAIGDVTGVMPFTHVGMYQARIVAADIAGEDRHASYEAIPRVVFSDPEIAAVGLTVAQAHERGLEVSVSRIRLPEQIARPWTYERDPRGELGLIADRERDVLIGAWAVAPLAGEWIHYAALAIRARVALATLADTVAQFPTYSEAFLKAVELLGQPQP